MMEPTDEVLLLHSMFCIAAADGAIDEAEDEALRVYANTLPEFRHMSGGAFQDAVDASVAIAQRFKRDMKASLQVLAEIKREEIRNKAFVLAVDIARSSGAVVEAEQEMLDAMQRVLRVDDALAQRIVEVISLKYAR